MRYRCVKDLYLDKYDEDGFYMDGEYVIIPIGSIWTINQCGYRLVGGQDTIHLELETNDKEKFQWIEILESTLKEHFMEIEKDFDYK